MTLRSNRPKAWLLSVVMLTTWASCNATVLSYLDRADWLGNLPTDATLVLDDFSYTRANSAAITFASGVASIAEEPGGITNNTVVAGQYAGSLSLTRDHGYRRITWHFPEAIYGFAAQWLSTNSLDGTTITIAGADFFLGDLLGSPGTGFLGFISDQPLTQISFAANGGTNNENFGVDDLELALSLPEPSTLILSLFFGAMVYRQLHPRQRR